MKSLTQILLCSLAGLALHANVSNAAISTSKSLVITDTEILNTFSAREVVEKLINDTGDTQQSAQDILDNWPGCQNRLGGTFNGFPVACAGVDMGDIDTYIPIAITNRFDLAASDGSNCGEYRIAFADIIGFGFQVNFMIFEAQLPNPNPQAGLEGCRPIAEFWADLSQISSATQNAASIHGFFFNGINGMAPAIHADHFAGGENGSGQIRLNQRNARLTTWNQFEFRTEPTVGSLVIRQSTTKDTPFSPLASDDSNHPLASSFKQAVLNAISTPGDALLASTISTLSIDLPDIFALGSSFSDDFDTDIDGGVLGTFDSNGNFAANIQAQLNAVNSALTPDEIIARVNVLSCGGCHNHSLDLGGTIDFLSIGQNSEFLSLFKILESTPEKIEAENYIVMSGIQTETAQDTGGGENVGWLDAGDFVTYDINLPLNDSNVYQISYRVASLNGGGSLQLSSNNQALGNTVSIPNTSGWQNWVTINQNVAVPAGTTKLTIQVSAGGWNLNWFEIRGNAREHFEVKTALKTQFIPERKEIIEQFLLGSCNTCNINLVSNGDFDAGSLNWQTYIQSPAIAAFNFNTGYDDVRTLISNEGTQDWHIQLYQAGITIEQGATYTLSFDAETYGKTVGASINVVVEENGNDYTQYLPVKTATTNPGGTHHSYTFTMPVATDTDARVTFNLGLNEEVGGGVASNIGIDNVKLVKNF